MSDRWFKYHSDDLGQDNHWLKTAVSHWQFYQTFYGMISRHMSVGSKVLDIGCGHSFSDLYLASYGYNVTAVDNDERIIELAKDFAKVLNVELDYQQADAFDLSPFYGEFDLVYSVGVLEHFDREVTVALLKEQAKCANKVLICIPTQYTKYSAGITDERIYSVGELENIVKEAGLDVVDSFGFGSVNATALHRWIRRLIPHGLFRLFQNKGYAYNIAVIGQVPTDSF